MSRVLKTSCPSSTTFNTNHNSRIPCVSRRYISIRCAMRAEVRMQRCNSFMRLSQCHLWLQHHLIVILTAYLMMNQESPRQEAINCDQRSSLLTRNSAIHKSILSMVMETLVVMWVVDRAEVDILLCRSKDVTGCQIIIEACRKPLTFNVVKTITRHMYEPKLVEESAGTKRFHRRPQVEVTLFKRARSW